MNYFWEYSYYEFWKTESVLWHTSIWISNCQINFLGLSVWYRQSDYYWHIVHDSNNRKVRDRIPVGTRFSAVQTDRGAHPASCKMGTGSFPGVKCGWGVLLTTHPLPVPRSWKSRAIPLPTLWATPGLWWDHFNNRKALQDAIDHLWTKRDMLKTQFVPRSTLHLR